MCQEKRKSLPYWCVEISIPSSDRIGRGWGSQQSEWGTGTSTPNTGDDREKTFLGIQEDLGMDFAAAQEATGSCSKARWNGLLCWDTTDRGRAVFKAFILNPFPAADTVFLYLQNNTVVCAELKLGGCTLVSFDVFPLKEKKKSLMLASSECQQRNMYKFYIN